MSCAHMYVCMHKLVTEALSFQYSHSLFVDLIVAYERERIIATLLLGIQ